MIHVIEACGHVVNCSKTCVRRDSKYMVHYSVFMIKHKTRMNLLYLSIKNLLNFVIIFGINILLKELSTILQTYSFHKYVL